MYSYCPIFFINKTGGEMELVKQLCKLTSCFTLLHVLFSRDIINEVLYLILMDIMEFVRNVFLVGKKNKSGAAR